MKKLFKTYLVAPNYHQTTSTTYVTSWYPQRFLYDTNTVDTSHLEIFFEVSAWSNNAAATTYVRLWNTTDGAAVANSEVSTNSTSYVRLRSSAITLTNGKRYEIQQKTSNGTYQSEAREPHLIYKWDSDTDLTKFEEIICLHGSAYNQTGTAATQLTESNLWTYNADDYDGSIDVEFVTYTKGSSSVRTCVCELYDITASSVTASSTVSTTAWTLSTVTGVSLTDGHQYCVRLRRGGGTSTNVYVENVYLILKQHDTPTKSISNINMTAQTITSTSTAYVARGHRFYYDPSLVEGNTVTADFLGTISSSSAASTASLKLSDDDNSESYGIVTTTSTAKINVVDDEITLPEDAGLMGCWYKSSNGSFNITLYHSWIELKISPIPEATLTVANLDCAVTSDNIDTTHTDGPVLTVANLDCAVTEGAVAVRPHLHLTVANLDCAVTEGAVVLTDIVIVIEPDNATLAVTEDSPLVLSPALLEVGNLDCAVTSSEPTVTFRTTLTVGNLDCAVTSDSITLEAVTIIAPDGAILATSIDAFVVTCLTPLTVGDLDCSVISDNIDTTSTIPHWDLTVGNLDVTVTSDDVGVYPTAHLIVADLDCAVIMDAPVVTFRYVLITQDMTCSVTSDSPTLEYIAIINPDGAILAVTEDNVVVIGDQTLVVGNLDCSVTEDAIVVSVMTVLVVGDLDCAVTSDNTTLYSVIIIDPDNAVLASTLEAFVVTAKGPVTITPDGAILASTLEEFVVTVKLPATINPDSNIIATMFSDIELFWFDPVTLVVANLDLAVTLDGPIHTTNENYQLLVVQDMGCSVTLEIVYLTDSMEYVDISGLSKGKQRRIHKRLHRPSKGEKGRYYYCPHCMHIVDSNRVSSKPHNRVAYYKMHSDDGEDIWVPNVIDGCPLCGKGQYK